MLTLEIDCYMQVRRNSCSAVLVTIALQIGCGSPEELQSVMSQVQQARSNQPGLLASLDSEKAVIDNQAYSTHTFPSPDRENPFEWDDNFSGGNAESKLENKRDIKIVGFVKTDVQRVMISLNKQVYTMTVGETLNRVSVTEIDVPRAKLSYDGIEWTASLFDR